jgi:hypothetical protein
MGVAANKGERGNPGPSGELGAHGAPGDRGQQGLQGDQGLLGNPVSYIDIKSNVVMVTQNNFVSDWATQLKSNIGMSK